MSKSTHSDGESGLGARGGLSSGTRVGAGHLSALAALVGPGEEGSRRDGATEASRLDSPDSDSGEHDCSRKEYRV